MTRTATGAATDIARFRPTQTALGAGPAGWTAARRPLRIAMLAPPWIPVPPPGYGGTEAVVDLLCDRLVRAGHDVTLLAAPGSHSVADVFPLLDRPHPHEIGAVLHEADHVAAALDHLADEVRSGRGFDVLHDHSGFVAVAMADAFPAPVVHTLHGPFSEANSAFYRRHGHKVALVAISRSQASLAPAGVQVAAVVPNPIAVEEWPFRDRKDGYLLWIGRVDPVKGPHEAILAAAAAGRRLVLAGPVQSGQEEYFRTSIEPHVDGVRVRYIGEVAGRRKRQLFAGASALLMPIRWEEPFGMVMVEALACGTPVVAYPRGAAAEIVVSGRNGFLVRDPEAMAAAVRSSGEIDPAQCRADARARFDATAVAHAYARVYRDVATAAFARRRATDGATAAR
jgi:glycosyltransferase involved in cell wall biosynthesis